jgi:hypothetical protein
VVVALGLALVDMAAADAEVLVGLAPIPLPTVLVALAVVRPHTRGPVAPVEGIGTVALLDLRVGPLLFLLFGVVSPAGLGDILPTFAVERVARSRVRPAVAVERVARSRVRPAVAVEFGVGVAYLV